MPDALPGPPADPSVKSALPASELIADLEGFAQEITKAVRILDKVGLPYSVFLIRLLPGLSRGLTETWGRAIDLAAKARVNPPPKPEPPTTVAEYQTAAVRIAAWGREAADLVRRAHPPARVRCEKSDRSVYLDGKKLAAGLGEDVFAYMEVLAGSYPDPIPFAKIKEKSNALEGANQSRLKLKIPNRLKHLVQQIPNKGHVLKLPV